MPVSFTGEQSAYCKLLPASSRPTANFCQQVVGLLQTFTSKAGPPLVSTFVTVGLPARFRSRRISPCSQRSHMRELTADASTNFVIIWPNLLVTRRTPGAQAASPALLRPVCDCSRPPGGVVWVHTPHGPCHTLTSGAIRAMACAAAQLARIGPGGACARPVTSPQKMSSRRTRRRMAPPAFTPTRCAHPSDAHN